VAALATRERPARVIDPPATARPAPRLFEPPGGEVSLEDSILGAWEDLTLRGDAGCPVCGGRMHAAGHCPDCGSELT
jgi:hypothetical protein